MKIRRYGTTRRHSHMVAHHSTVYLVDVVAKLDADITAQTQNLLSNIDQQLIKAHSNKSRLLMLTIYQSTISSRPSLAWKQGVAASVISDAYIGSERTVKKGRPEMATRLSTLTANCQLSEAENSEPSGLVESLVLLDTYGCFKARLGGPVVPRKRGAWIETANKETCVFSE